VTSLEPRTPHQPGKLQNVSKNDYGFTTLSFYVNENHASVTSYSSIECSSCTGGWHGNWAYPEMGISNRQRLCGISRFLCGRLCFCPRRMSGAGCANCASVAWILILWTAEGGCRYDNQGPAPVLIQILTPANCFPYNSLW